MTVRMTNYENFTDVNDMIDGNFFFILIMGGYLAVDLFFFVGGFLVAYSVMREKSR